MENIKVKVNISLSTALRLGKSQHGVTEVALTDEDVASMSVEARGELAAIRNGGIFAPIADNGTDYNYNWAALDLEVADATHVVAALEERAAHRAECRRKFAQISEETIAKAVAAPDADWIRNRQATFEECHVLSMPVGVYLTDAQQKDPRIVERRNRPSLLAELGRRREADIASDKAAKMAEQERIAAHMRQQEAQREEAARQIKALVSDHGTEDQRERLSAGVLPQREIDALVYEHVFAPLAGLPPYVRRTESDIAHSSDEEEADDCLNCEIDWSAEPTDDYELDSAGFATLKEAKEATAKIPGATLDVVRHRAKLSCSCEEPSWLAARVTVTFGGRDYKRSIALD